MVKNKLSTVMDGATDRSVIVNKFAVLTSKLQCFIQPSNTWDKSRKLGGHMASAKREPITEVWGKPPAGSRAKTL